MSVFFFFLMSVFCFFLVFFFNHTVFVQSTEHEWNCFFCDGGLFCPSMTHSIFFKKQKYFPFCFSLSEVAPYLQGSGLGQQVVLEGNRLVLTCLAGGSWPLQYRWTLNNTNITDWTPQYRSVSSGQLIVRLTFCPACMSVTPLPPSLFSIPSFESLVCVQ